MARASLDQCGNCRFWDPHDKNLSQEDRDDDRGVCWIMSYPEEFDNGFAYATDNADPKDGDESSGSAELVVVTVAEFFCNLYKVGG
jgi:hypothetical protein